MRYATADLFAEGQTDAGAVEATLPLVRRLPTLPQPASRARFKQLWYAVVFPELTECGPPAAGLLQRLCLAAQQFTPFVSIDLPNVLLLEIKGSVNLFGSLPALHASIDAAWSGIALRAQSAVAPTTLAALWLARAGKRVCIEDPGSLAGELAGVPTACTCWDAERLQTLRSMGVTRLGELLRLPRAGIARRLTPAAVTDLDIALARQAAPRRAFILRERFRVRCDFETEIETVVYLQKALQPSIEACARFLRERQAGVQALELRLRHRVIPMTRVRVGLAGITGERQRLAQVLDDKLHRLALAAPVRSMELRSGALQPLSADSLDAFVGLRGGGRDTVPQLVERLRARLGEAAVYGLCSVPEHRPEAAWRRIQELQLTSGAPMRGAPVTEMRRPVWLLEAPMLLAADGRDLSEQGVRLEQGPERIESGWWDGRDVARDYYVARQMRGATWWIFQERHSHSWYLHGVFS